MYCCYILESEKDYRLYIGQTNNLENRLFRHNNNMNLATKNRGPWILLFSIECDSRSEAMQLEKKLKGFKRPDRIRDWINS